MRYISKSIILIMVSFFLINVSSTALAWSVGDRVYVIFGSGSGAEVESGNIAVVGGSNSKVEWDSCYNCPDWVSNGSFYRSYSSAKSRRDEMDESHLSVGEAVGAAAILGAIYLIMNE